MMLTILLIILWLLSGFLAAYFLFKVMCKEKYDFPNHHLLAWTLLGPISWLMCAGNWVVDNVDLSNPILKAKEPK